MPDAQKIRDWNDNRLKVQSAITSGKIFQLKDGRSAYYTGQNALAVGDTGQFESLSLATVNKANVALLDGGPVFWDRTNAVATFKRLGANRGFYMGRAIGDALQSDTTAAVNFNLDPRYDLDLVRDPYTPAPVGTQALTGLRLERRGGALGMVLDATNQAQKLDALGNEPIVVGCKGILQTRINVINTGAGGAQDFNIGIASGTNATDADAIAQHLFLHLDGNAVIIKFQSKDGTHTTAATDSTKTYTAGTPFEAWFDFRDPTKVTLYVEGVQVLSSTVFDISAGASNWFLLAHLEKTAAVDVYEVQVDWEFLRTAEQSTNGV